MYNIIDITLLQHVMLHWNILTYVMKLGPGTWAEQ